MIAKKTFRKLQTTVRACVGEFCAKLADVLSECRVKIVGEDDKSFSYITKIIFYRLSCTLEPQMLNIGREKWKKAKKCSRPKRRL